MGIASTCGRPVRYISSNGQGSCNKYSRCPTWDEQHEHIGELKTALRKAMFCRHFTVDRCVEVSEAGNIYERSWTAEFEDLARIAGVDLTQYSPSDF